MSNARDSIARVIRNSRRVRRLNSPWERGYIMGYALALVSSAEGMDTYYQVRRIVSTYF